MSPEREGLQIFLVNASQEPDYMDIYYMDAFADKASPLLFVSPTFDRVSISVLVFQVDQTIVSFRHEVSSGSTSCVNQDRLSDDGLTSVNMVLNVGNWGIIYNNYGSSSHSFIPYA